MIRTLLATITALGSWLDEMMYDAEWTRRFPFDESPRFCAWPIGPERSSSLTNRYDRRLDVNLRGVPAASTALALSASWFYRRRRALASRRQTPRRQSASPLS
jgi:hypothetical protein